MMLMHCRPKQHDEQGRQDEEDQRKQHLDRHLHGVLFGPLPPLDPHVFRLGLEDARNGDAVGVCLDHRPDESYGRPAHPPVRPSPGRLPCGTAPPGYPAASGSVRPPGAAAVFACPAHGGFETQSGLNRDQHLVQRVGKFQPDLFPALLGPVRDEDVRDEVSQCCDDEHDQETCRADGDARKNR